MLFRYKVFILGTVCILLILVLALLIRHHENKVLQKALQQYETQLRQKQEEILQLQQALQILSAEQVRIEKRITMQKQKKEAIVREVAVLKSSEVCDELKRLGYNPTCN